MIQIRLIVSAIFVCAVLLGAQTGLQNLRVSGESTNSPGLSITIGGSFMLTGTFTAFPGERLDQFVTRIFAQGKAERLAAITNPAQKEEILKELQKYSKRDITLKRSAGQTIKIDLEKYHLNGDFANNPYLQHDDFIFFPPFDLERNFFSITGAVNNPGKMQFVQGDKLQDAIAFAFGIDPAYERIDKVVISRLDLNGEKETLLNFSVDDNPELQRGDRIVISAFRSEKKDFRVRILGEVNKPGYIPISRSGTTLRDVIERAGGFTSKADLTRAELLRGANVFKSSYFTEEFEALLMNRMADITPEDSPSFYADNKLRVVRGNGLIDFVGLMSDTSSSGKFLLQDEDYIFIPEKIDLVYVFGHVNNPGYVPYTAAKGYDYYLSKAGGKGQNPKPEIYVIKGKSRSWAVVNPEKPPVIEPGDYIWIPKEPARTFEYYLSRITAVSGVISATATILLLIVQLTK
jgi:protein involved in polysaccharide export with SLBB domain